MHNETITFQLATHFLPKIAIRLESLFQTVEQACIEKHPIIHQYALKNVIEIIKLIEKPELKSRFLKEFMRIEHVLNKTTSSITDNLHQALLQQTQDLNLVVGRFGESLHQDLFLQSVRLAQTSYHSNYEMQTPPQLLLWLDSSDTLRQKHLTSWLKQLVPLYKTVKVYLALLRCCGEFEKIRLANGFYQCSLPSRACCHLILLKMNKSAAIAPKMQLGHHGLTIRLCDATTMQELNRCEEDIHLAFCII